MSNLHVTQFDRWLHELEERHFAALRFAEVTRALRALSSAYVERRGALTARGTFDGAGKRAAYALFYAPLHFLTVSAIIRQLPGATGGLRHLVDLGCGTGAAGAAWAAACSPSPRVIGLDVHPWALTEAALTYQAFGLDGSVRRGDVAAARVPAADGIVAGWVMNEVNEHVRNAVLSRLLQLASRGVRVLVVEPIATRISPWWREWADAFTSAGGRADEWRFEVVLPDLLKRLDRAAGLRHDELTARSLWIGGGAKAPPLHFA